MPCKTSSPAQHSHSLSEFQPESRVGNNGQLVTMEGLYPSLWTRISFLTTWVLRTRKDLNPGLISFLRPHFHLNNCSSFLKMKTHLLRCFSEWTVCILTGMTVYSIPLEKHYRKHNKMFLKSFYRHLDGTYVWFDEAKSSLWVGTVLSRWWKITMVHIGRNSIPRVDKRTQPTN